MVFAKVIEDNNFSHSSFLVASCALDLIQMRYGVGNGEMAFHQFKHSFGVMQRAREIMKIFVSAGIANYADLCLATIAAACHDVVQEFEVVSKGEPGSDDAKYGRRVRKRKIGQNEEASAKFAVDAMRSYNAELGEEAFTDEYCAIVTQAIMGTIPAWNNTYRTMVQKALVPNCHPVVHAVLMADIGNAGIGKGNSWIVEGDQLLREEDFSLRELDFSKLDRSAEDYWRGVMLGWGKGQVSFAEGRRNRFEREIEWLPAEVQVGMQKLFCNFENSVSLQRSTNATREQMSTYQLWKAMGF